MGGRLVGARYDRILALYTDDCVYEDVAFGVVKHGKAALRAFAVGTFTVIPDFTVEVTARFVADQWGALEWRLSGTHHGNLPGLPATGKRFAVGGTTLFTLQAGKIRRSADYWDAATFMRQVGLLPTQSGRLSRADEGVENEKRIIPDGPSNVLIYNTKNVELFGG